MSPEGFELDRSDPAYAGQAVYTPRMLRAYDSVVTKFSNSLLLQRSASLNELQGRW
jgi:hypothetical protein